MHVGFDAITGEFTVSLQFYARRHENIFYFLFEFFFALLRFHCCIYDDDTNDKLCLSLISLETISSYIHAIKLLQMYTIGTIIFRAIQNS